MVLVILPGLEGRPPQFPRPDKEEFKTKMLGGQEIQGSKVALLRRATPLQEGSFAGNKTFIVPTSAILEVKTCKRKGAHWSKYLPEDNVGEAIREWANANPNLPIILEDDLGNLIYVRYGKS